MIVLKGLQVDQHYREIHMASYEGASVYRFTQERDGLRQDENDGGGYSEYKILKI